ncbi:hypothetical protein DRO69_02220 [Candidatus Bathyarchaeota archaeon]|nr:MAG: hypothetical protein DRO69_02220 [Candidatus Bathyarchaeota archaeon]
MPSLLGKNIKEKPLSHTLLKGFNVNHRKGLFLSFIFGFVTRLIPEVLSYRYPIGFDTVYYAARIESGVVWHHWTSVFSTWLLYGILIPVYQVAQVYPFLLLKLVAPVLYALNVCGVYYFSRMALGWDVPKGLIASFFFAFQLASLRLSWDLYRNMLGLAILLFTLPLIWQIETKKGVVLFILLSLFVIFSHEYASVVLFVVVLAVAIINLFKANKARIVKILMASLPAFAVFLASLYIFMTHNDAFEVSAYQVILPYSSDVATNVMNVGDTFHPSPDGFGFFVDYLGVVSLSHSYVSYFDLASKVFSLFAVLYLLNLPLIFIGFFRNQIIDVWTSLLLFGSFNALITPFCALNLWDRWMLMLVYPFTFYAVNGISKIRKSLSGNVNSNFKWLRRPKVSKTITYGTFFTTLLAGSVFMVTPLFYGRYGVFSLPNVYPYFPATMQVNTLPLQDTADAIRAMKWLNLHIIDSSSLIVHESFLPWAILYLDRTSNVLYFAKDIQGAVNLALAHDFNPIYFIWWNLDIGWYGIVVPAGFEAVFGSGRISVFEYRG